MDGVYCSTAGEFFQEREDLQAHYQSDYHRYNLKRKIAGLPPVTREWYESRKSQLQSSATGAVQRVWFDPLSSKKFYSENTYLAYTKSKKYKELVKKSGKPAPPAVVTLRKINNNEGAAVEQQQGKPASATGFTVKPAVKGGPAAAAQQDGENSGEEEGDVDSGSEWETDSENEMEGSKNWEDWDVCRSLFDNHISPSMEANLEYMWKKFGFYLPDAEYLTDPAGLIKYLGAKLTYGHIPLYESGDNPNAKQCASLHGVQRHMIDVGKCKLLYDDNEDEYADFYDYGDDDEEESMDVDGQPSSRNNNNMVLATANAEAAATAAGAYELALPSTTGGVKILGSREFARYYRQRHRLGDGRSSTAAARVVAEYTRLSVPLLGDGTETAVQKKRARNQERRAEQHKLAVSMRRNVNDNLPRNVPY